MSLALEYDNQLLVCGNGRATIELSNEVSIEISGVERRERVSYLSGGIPESEHFFVAIGELSEEMQFEIRSHIIETQLEIDKNHPRYRQRYRPFYDNSPLPVEIPDEYQLVLVQHKTHRAHPCLRLGKELFVYAKIPFDGPMYSLGVITNMDVHP